MAPRELMEAIVHLGHEGLDQAWASLPRLLASWGEEDRHTRPEMSRRLGFVVRRTATRLGFGLVRARPSRGAASCVSYRLVIPRLHGPFRNYPRLRAVVLAYRSLLTRPRRALCAATNSIRDCGQSYLPQGARHSVAHIRSRDLHCWGRADTNRPSVSARRARRPVGCREINPSIYISHDRTAGER